MALDTATASVLLLGGGFTLSRVAEQLKPGTFVITSRNISNIESWRARGWLAERVSISNSSELIALNRNYPNITTIVDSVPPLKADEGVSKGASNVVAAFNNPEARRIIYLSTTGVFGRRDGSWVDETSEPAPWNEQGAARLVVENTYRASGSKTVALRLPAIYGHGRGIEQSLRNGAYRIVGDGLGWSNRIHVDDLVTVILKLIESAEVPPVLCVSDDEPTQARTIVQYFCDKLSLHWPPSVSEDELLARGAFTMLSNQRVSNRLLHERLGIKLKHPSFRSVS